MPIVNKPVMVTANVMAQQPIRTANQLANHGWYDSVMLGDCIELAKKLPPASVDLVFADPPYNLQLNEKNTLYRPDQSPVAGVRNGWDQFASFQIYDDFTKQWLTAMRRLLKPNGTIWVIGSYHNIFRLGKIMQDLGFWILNDVVWIKHNPMPNFRGRRFTNAHETLIWAARDKTSRYFFHYHAMKCLNDDLQMRSDWYLPICNGTERIKLPMKKNSALNPNPTKTAHPTQKPLALLQRLLLASTQLGDVVLDPFLGTGTTAVAAKQLQRHYIGFEREKSYLQLAKARIKKTKILTPEDLSLSLSPLTAAGKKRIAFGALVEQGVVKVGSILTSPCNKFHAKVRADGSLVVRLGQEQWSGSIHRLAAQLLGLTSCNGWTYWQIQQSGKTIPLDNLRITSV